MSTCANCGSQIAATASFCPNCGTNLCRATPQTDAVPGSVLSGARIPENLAGALAYFFLPAIVFLWVPPYDRNRFVRFHSLQCLFTVGVLVVVHLCLGILWKFLPLLAIPFYGLLLLADLTLWLLLLVKAYRHEMFKLPVVGTLAEQRANVIAPETAR